MKRSGIVHLAGVLFAALYLLASSPIAAQYTVVSLSDESAIQATSPNSTTATVTADLFACLEGVGPFAIRGFFGPPNTTVVMKVMQTVSGVLGFSNTGEPDSFTVTIDILVPLDGTGNGQSAPFYIKGVGLGQTDVSICNDQQQCASPFDPATSIVFKVESVEWEAVDSPLDANPNAGGGLRIFPDKDSPGDTRDKTAVKVKIALSSEVQWNVHLRAFDVDDPSTDNTVIDRDGAGGIDNLGTTPGISYVSGIGNASGLTNPDGTALFTLQLSKQPGDNFRIAGACIHAEREGLTVDGLEVKDSSGRTLPTETAKVTPLLTVWRRLHIEVDTMGPVRGNYVEGTVTKARFTKGTTILTLANPLQDYESFEKGRITIENVGYPVVGTSGRTVTVQGAMAQDPKNKIFRLVDDDDFNNNDVGALDGDEGEALPEPDQSWVKDSDLPAENVFAVAYVKPTYDLAGKNIRPIVPFVPHSVFLWEQFDNHAIDNKDYWTAYLLGTYQHSATFDGDPDDEETQWGSGSPSYGANVFLEVGRPQETTRYPDKAAFVNQAATTAHELGHWFGAPDCNAENPDPEGGLMCWPNLRQKGTFSAKTLAVIRNKYNN